MHETKDPRPHELDVIAIPDDVPEIGVGAGHLGTIVDVHADGTLTVDVSDDKGRTLDLLDMVLDPEPKIIGRWHLGSLA